MKTFLVVTSIAPPTQAMIALGEGARLNNWNFLCVGDLRGPREYSLLSCEFLSFDRQQQMPFRLAEAAPQNHYSRKNLGYLLAASQGAEILVETDDDNFPQPGFWAERSRTLEGRQVDAEGWINVYNYFTAHEIWPRGFPLELLADSKRGSLSPIRADCPIQQGLANGDPDVDAVFRMTRRLPLSFDPGSPIVLSSGRWCPFNSQNTTWWREAFPLLYLPSTCSFRMTDIWRSFVAQRCAWAAGWSIAFHEPTVFQHRNQHDLLKDFAQEVPGYLRNDLIARGLAELDLPKGTNALLENLRSCYRFLIGMGVIDCSELTLLDLWLQDMNTLG